MEQQIKKQLTKETGSITLFVLVAGLFMIIVLFGMFVTSQNKKMAQEQELQTIVEQYKTNVEEMDQLYEKNNSNARIKFSTNITSNDSNSWKCAIENIKAETTLGNIVVRYKKQEETTWNTTNNSYFIIEEPGVYQIQLEDSYQQVSEITKAYAYVKNGLVLFYDGIQNTRAGNKPLATSWEDLSGNGNDGIFYHMNSDSGYYDQEENGYVFLENKSYIQSKNNIGISGDSLYTTETVMNPWKEGSNSIYPNPYSSSTALWWGTNSTSEVGSSFIFYYDRNNKKIGGSYVNNFVLSENQFDLKGTKFNMSYRKIKTGEITNGMTDIAKMNCNGELVSCRYEKSTFIQNLIDSPIQVGRDWQYQEQNRTFYGSIQAIRIYNRALTDDEIKINYQIDQERYQIK